MYLFTFAESIYFVLFTFAKSFCLHFQFTFCYFPGFHDLDPVATFHPPPTYTMTSDQFRPQYYEPPYVPPPVHHTTHAPFIDEIIDILPGETLLTDPNLHCYERSCTQNITGT